MNHIWVQFLPHPPGPESSSPGLLSTKMLTLCSWTLLGPHPASQLLQHSRSGLMGRHTGWKLYDFSSHTTPFTWPNLLPAMAHQPINHPVPHAAPQPHTRMISLPTSFRRSFRPLHLHPQSSFPLWEDPRHLGGNPVCAHRGLFARLWTCL